MRFIPAEPDIATVFRRIMDSDIDLQPDFQRGEVWPISKQQRLIDSILRGWVVPPVLLISSGHGQPQQVLDGQQRLASIRDFMLDKFSIDGRIDPLDASIQSIHGIRFSALPPDVSKAFLRTPVRMYEINDYRPEEPAEIFFRLNQPTGLTPAEKRNAFFGPVRDQIRAAVVEFEDLLGSQKSQLGFSNSRMAYDDVFARFVCTLELNTLRTKITASAVNNMYRRSTPLNEGVFSRLENAIRYTHEVLRISESIGGTGSPRLNKATFFSWLMFFSRLNAVGDLETISKFFNFFETVRQSLADGSADSSKEWFHAAVSLQRTSLPLMLLYSDRASSRVADVSSVLLRDFSLWASWYEFSGGNRAGCTDYAYVQIPQFLDRLVSFRPEQIESMTLEFVESIAWGGELSYAKGRD